MHQETESLMANLVPLNRIRVETALSRFPIHRLAKKGNISIDLRGDADFKWEVTYNAKHGQPGPHAYKLDTLIINRRIDEAPRPLPEVIRLGSLREINRELGFAEEDTQTVKRALIQNASAFISAKIRFKPKNAKGGRERWREIHYSRYSVIFNGEALPDGSIADAVYIVLNHPHWQMLNDAEVRPLNYDYLVKLPPGPQRLYELMSFQIYGAIASGRSRAKLLYSEYCMCAPQVRYFTFDGVKKQMFKLHVPHRQSGYILKVDYQQTIDSEGKPDWEMFYTPGPKAMAEYQAFTNRQIRQQVSAPTLPFTAIAGKYQPVQSSLELTEHDHPQLIELTRRSVTEKKARELLAELTPGQEVMDQIEWTDSIIAKARAGKFHNPPGLYVATIRDNVAPPATFLSSRKRRLQEEARQAKNVELAQHAQHELAYAEYQSEAIETYIAELPEREYQEMLLEARRQFKRTYTSMTEAQLEDLAANWVRAEVKNGGRVRVMGFAEFCAVHITR